MALFLALLLGHLLGDFVFQPGRLVVAKRHHTRGVVLHTAIVTLCTALAVLGEIATVWPAVVLVGTAHLGIEYLTIRARRMMEASGLALFVLDQALHIVSLAIIAAVISGGGQAHLGPWHVSLTTLAVTCGLLGVMFLGSILAFEVRVVALGAADAGPAGPILRLDANRILGFAERGLALGAGLVAPFAPLGILVFVPRTAYALTHETPGRTSHLIDAAVGLAICSVTWLLIVLATSARP